MQAHGGYSRTARKRRKQAAKLSQQMRHGDGDAAFSLLQRRRALAGIKKNGWSFKVHAMNTARYQKREQRLERPWTLETPQMARARQAAELDMRLAERVTLESKLAAERAHKQALKELEARLQRQRSGRSESEAMRIAALQERKARERDIAWERMRKQAMRELEARLQRQRSGR